MNWGRKLNFFSGLFRGNPWLAFSRALSDADSKRHLERTAQQEAPDLLRLGIPLGLELPPMGLLSEEDDTLETPLPVWYGKGAGREGVMSKRHHKAKVKGPGSEMARAPMNHDKVVEMAEAVNKLTKQVDFAKRLFEKVEGWPKRSPWTG